VIKALADKFDWILVDSPPVVALSDAVFLRQHSDATLLVVRAGHTPQAAVDESIRQLGRHHIAAVVLNAVEGLERTYYKYGSPYYKSSRALALKEPSGS
jgi:tyrosine-protein kinase Etk/Wzc